MLDYFLASNIFITMSYGVIFLGFHTLLWKGINALIPLLLYFPNWYDAEYLQNILEVNNIQSGKSLAYSCPLLLDIAISSVVVLCIDQLIRHLLLIELISFFLGPGIIRIFIALMLWKMKENRSENVLHKAAIQSGFKTSVFSIVIQTLLFCLGGFLSLGLRSSYLG